MLKFLLNILLVPCLISAVFSQPEEWGYHGPTFLFNVPIYGTTCTTLTWPSDPEFDNPDTIEIRYWPSPLDTLNWDSARQIFVPDQIFNDASFTFCNIPYDTVWYYGIRYGADNAWGTIINAQHIYMASKIDSLFVHFTLMLDTFNPPDLSKPDTLWGFDSAIFKIIVYDGQIDSVYPGVYISGLKLYDFNGGLINYGVSILMYKNFRYNLYAEDFYINGYDLSLLFDYLFK